MKFATKAIHTGQEPDPSTGAIMPPIYMTSTFALESPGVTKAGFDYTRANNPNFVILEKQLATLEGAQYATVFSAGLAALTALITTLSPGDKVAAIDGVYGGTYRLFNQVFKRYGIHFESYNASTEEDLEQLESVLASKPKWLFFETPTNPLLEVFDIEALVKLAKRYHVTTVVDNTFASPYCQNPLLYGVDVVWHSSTKYLGGHSDVIGGVVITQSDVLKKDLDFARKSLGLNPSPFDVWLITRGVKTLAVRMKQHIENAHAIARFLEKQPKVKKVHYPGLESHRNHEIAKKQMRGFGGMLSAEFDLPPEQIKKMISSFKLFTLAESLGGVESLVCHPATMTHASIPPIDRQKLGLRDNLVRFSIGIEDSEDLIQDLADVMK